MARTARPLDRPRPRPSARDLVAGLAVALVLIPQSIAYAQLAGLPAEQGLLGAAIGAAAAAALASYPLLQTGPTALTAALTLGALGGVAGAAHHDVLALGALLALLVGLVRVVLGLLGGGAVAYLLSEPVLAGLLPGITLSIALTQVGDLVGAPRTGGSRTVEIAWHALSDPSRWHGPTVVVGVASLLVLAATRRLDPRVPVIAILVIASMLWAWLAGYDGRVVGAVALSAPTSPLHLPWSTAGDLAVAAALIAVIGFVEPATIVRSHDEEIARWDPDRELVAQGVANLASGLAGGMPVGGSFSRTALVEAAGGRSRLATLVAGLLVAIAFPFMHVLAYLPTAVPAAIVAGAISGLIRLDQLARLRRSSRTQFLVAVAAFVATVGLAPRIDLAVAISIVVAVGVHLWRETRVPLRLVDEGATPVLLPSGVLWFGSAIPFEREARLAIEARLDAERVAIDLAGLGRVDITGVRSVARVLRAARDSGREPELRHVPPTTGGMVARVLHEEGLSPSVVARDG